MPSCCAVDARNKTVPQQKPPRSSVFFSSFVFGLFPDGLILSSKKMTGISKTTLNTIENGLTSPTLRQLEAIAIALDTKISALYDSEYK